MKAPLSFVSVKIMGSPSSSWPARSCDRALARRRAMPQVIREDAVGDQLLDMADALVARTLELLERQRRLADRRRRAARRRAAHPIAA